MADSEDAHRSEQILQSETATPVEFMSSPSHPPPPPPPPPFQPSHDESQAEMDTLQQPLRDPPPPPSPLQIRPQPEDELKSVVQRREDETPRQSPTLEASLCPLPSSPPHDPLPTIHTPVMDEKDAVSPIVSVSPVGLSPLLPTHDLLSMVKSTYDDKDSSNGTLSVRSASSLRTPSPLRYSMTPFSMTPGRPVSLMPPPDGRPRDDVPYDSPSSLAEPMDYPTLSGQGRRTTMYFNASRTSLHSIESIGSRQVKVTQEEEPATCWQSLKSCFGCH